MDRQEEIDMPAGNDEIARQSVYFGDAAGIRT